MKNAVPNGGWGFEPVDSEVSAPELLLSHTMSEVWWDENINWQYPNHLGESTPYADQNWVSHQGNIITYTIPLNDFLNHSGLDLISVYTVFLAMVMIGLVMNGVMISCLTKMAMP